jgi:hypothetical protein
VLTQRDPIGYLQYPDKQSLLVLTTWGFCSGGLVEGVRGVLVGECGGAVARTY